MTTDQLLAIIDRDLNDTEKAVLAARILNLTEYCQSANFFNALDEYERAGIIQLLLEIKE